jgi:hypothetical protein
VDAVTTETVKPVAERFRLGEARADIAAAASTTSWTAARSFLTSRE